jgi:hypothetical protein
LIICLWVQMFIGTGHLNAFIIQVTGAIEEISSGKADTNHGEQPGWLRRRPRPEPTSVRLWGISESRAERDVRLCLMNPTEGCQASYR